MIKLHIFGQQLSHDEFHYCLHNFAELLFASYSFNLLLASTGGLIGNSIIKNTSLNAEINSKEFMETMLLGSAVLTPFVHFPSSVYIERCTGRYASPTTRSLAVSLLTPATGLAYAFLGSLINGSLSEKNAAHIAAASSLGNFIAYASAFTLWKTSAHFIDRGTTTLDNLKIAVKDAVLGYNISYHNMHLYYFDKLAMLAAIYATTASVAMAGSTAVYSIMQQLKLTDDKIELSDFTKAILIGTVLFSVNSLYVTVIGALTRNRHHDENNTAALKWILPMQAVMGAMYVGCGANLLKFDLEQQKPMYAAAALGNLSAYSALAAYDAREKIAASTKECGLSMYNSMKDRAQRLSDCCAAPEKPSTEHPLLQGGTTTLNSSVPNGGRNLFTP